MTPAARARLDAIPPIATARLRLKPLQAADAPAVAALTDDPEVIAAIDFLTGPFSLEDAAALIRGNGDGRDCFLGCWHHNTLLGVVGAHLRANGEIEIGYWLGSAFHGRGFGTEAAGAVVAMLRRRFPHHRIVAECRPENRASWHVLEKLGFRATGADGHRPDRQRLVLDGT